LLVGNKSDLTSKKVVSYDEAKELADSLNIQFMETSAQNSHNVAETFQCLARKIKERLENTSQTKPAGISTKLHACQSVQQGPCC